MAAKYQPAVHEPATTTELASVHAERYEHGWLWMKVGSVATTLSLIAYGIGVEAGGPAAYAGLVVAWIGGAEVATEGDYQARQEA